MIGPVWNNQPFRTVILARGLCESGRFDVGFDVTDLADFDVADLVGFDVADLADRAVRSRRGGEAVVLVELAGVERIENLVKSGAVAGVMGR